MDDAWREVMQARANGDSGSENEDGDAPDAEVEAADEPAEDGGFTDPDEDD